MKLVLVNVRARITIKFCEVQGPAEKRDGFLS